MLYLHQKQGSAKGTPNFDSFAATSKQQSSINRTTKGRKRIVRRLKTTEMWKRRKYKCGENVGNNVGKLIKLHRSRKL